MAQAAKLQGAHAQIVHTISRNFTIRDTNQIMDQPIQRCQGNLDQYIRDDNEQPLPGDCALLESYNA